MVWWRQEPGHHQHAIDLVLLKYSGLSTRRGTSFSRLTTVPHVGFKLRTLATDTSFLTGCICGLQRKQAINVKKNKQTNKKQTKIKNYPDESITSWFLNDGYVSMNINKHSIQEIEMLACHQIDGIVQDCSISTANSLEILQSCTKPSKYIINLVLINPLWNVSVATSTVYYRFDIESHLWKPSHQFHKSFETDSGSVHILNLKSLNLTLYQTPCSNT